MGPAGGIRRIQQEDAGIQGSERTPFARGGEWMDVSGKPHGPGRRKDKALFPANNGAFSAWNGKNQPGFLRDDYWQVRAFLKFVAKRRRGSVLLTESHRS